MLQNWSTKKIVTDDYINYSLVKEDFEKGSDWDEYDNETFVLNRVASVVDLNFTLQNLNMFDLPIISKLTCDINERDWSYYNEWNNNCKLTCDINEIDWSYYEYKHNKCRLTSDVSSNPFRRYSHEQLKKLPLIKLVEMGNCLIETADGYLSIYYPSPSNHKKSWIIFFENVIDELCNHFPDEKLRDEW